MCSYNPTRSVELKTLDWRRRSGCLGEKPGNWGAPSWQWGCPGPCLTPLPCGRRGPTNAGHLSPPSATRAHVAFPFLSVQP